MPAATFQNMIFNLNQFWGRLGCSILPSYDMEMGAGTLHPITFKALLPQALSFSYIQACRRPKDGRFGESPQRLGHYYQYQTLIKPAPMNPIKLYKESLEYIGIDTKENEIRFVPDNWESPTLGASGIGWEVWLNGLEVSQFTYFQKVCSKRCEESSLEITYGLERLAMELQGVTSILDLKWNENMTYGQLFQEKDADLSSWSFHDADVEMLERHMMDYMEECTALAQKGMFESAYDMSLKATHIFNVLDARRAISYFDRIDKIQRLRNIARSCGDAFIKKHSESVESNVSNGNYPDQIKRFDSNDNMTSKDLFDNAYQEMQSLGWGGDTEPRSIEEHGEHEVPIAPEQAQEIKKNPLIEGMVKNFCKELHLDGTKDKYTFVHKSKNTQKVLDGYSAVLSWKIQELLIFLSKDKELWGTNPDQELIAQELSKLPFHPKLGSMASLIDGIKTLNPSEEIANSILIYYSPLVTQTWTHLGGETEERDTILKSIILNNFNMEIDPGITGRIAFMEKVYTLSKFFTLEQLPVTSKKDPYGLKSIATYICSCDHFSFDQMLKKVKLIGLSDQQALAMKEFCLKHMKEKICQGDKGLFRYFDSLHSSGEAAEKTGNNMPNHQNILNLKTFLENNEDCLHMYKRCKNIIKKSKLDYNNDETNPSLFEQEEEKALFDILSNIDEDNLENLCNALQPAVDKFFDSVLINHQDTKIAINRLSIVHGIKNAIDYHANLHHLL